MSNVAAERLVVCAGAHVKPECASAMEDFLAAQESDIYRFVMSDWLSEDQLRGAALLWIVNDSAIWDPVQFALWNEIPLLIPEANTTLKQICVSANCGMYYRDAADARLCLEFLLANDGIRKRLGSNGHAYVKRQSAKAFAR